MNSNEQPWMKYIPDHVSLYFVNYDDDLDDHLDLLQECIENNNLLRLEETVYYWWDYPEEQYLSDIKREIESDFEEDGYNKWLEWEDDIIEALREADDSTPSTDLLKNTGKLKCYYALGMSVDGWHTGLFVDPYRNTPESEEVKKICAKFGFERGSDNWNKVAEMVDEAGYGGDVRIYFEAFADDMISGNAWTEKQYKEDFKSIRFKGEFVIAIYNPSEGAGAFDYFELDHAFQFDRDNLYCNESGEFCLQNTFGLCGNWLSECASPEFSMEYCRTAKKINKSADKQRAYRERELWKIFREGGCTPGDMNIKRHRGVTYVNDFPCGDRCPHCGTMWYD